ncbi:MAG TPA: hypothetical protein VFT99_09990, partial [Roseiflexaceae bacterium]|nr:hypothetical protein [Roseiflexaceae bacterium]
MSAVLAILVCIPLIYLPGWLLARAAGARVDAPDSVERIYERVLVGALLNGWLAFTLAELGLFSAWLHIVLLVLACLPALVRAISTGRAAPLGFSALARPAPVLRNRQRSTNWR